eukprot:scaffold126188_cov57-Phaeocystis_antarctica.AAC.2
MLRNNKENRGTREPVGKEKQRHKRCHAAPARLETKAPLPPPPPPPVTSRLGLAVRAKGQKPEAELAAPRPAASGDELRLEQEAAAEVAAREANSRELMEAVEAADRRFSF